MATAVITPRFRARQGIQASRVGDWPATVRVLPWSLAILLTVLMLMPVDAVTLRVNSPVDAKLDRLLMLPILIVWVLSFTLPDRSATVLPRLRWLGPALFAWASLSVLSVVVNIPELSATQDLGLATKRLAALFGYVAFLAVVCSVIRAGERRAFTTLFIGLGCLTAVGTMYQYRSGTNVFFSWTASLLPGQFDVATPPTATRFYDRPAITGPTAHGLAVTTMLALVFPFALQRLLEPGSRRRQFLYGLTAALILAGGMATLRKTAGIVFVVPLVVFVLYRPRLTKTLAPVAVAMVFASVLVAPGALRSVYAQLTDNDKYGRTSTLGRTSDYSAIAPDLRARPVLGKGYGTYDPFKYRILDNQLLLTTVETGFVGLSAYLLMLAAAFSVTHNTIRRSVGRAPPSALAGGAAILAFVVANVLFDALSFPQTPYILLFVVGLCLREAHEGSAGESSPVPAEAIAD